MPWPKRRRGQLGGTSTAKRQKKERGWMMSWPSRRRGKADNPPIANRHLKRLYLVLDDYPWGYSIREMNLPPPFRKTHSPCLHKSKGKGALQRLPPPVICFEAPRGYPLYFAAVGTRIVATHLRNPFGFDQSVPGGFLPIVDVRWRGVTFGPGQGHHDIPIYLPVEDELLCLDACNFKKLSFKPHWPPRLENRESSDAGWSWCELPQPPFDTMDVTSYAIVGRNILFSTDTEGEPTLQPDGKTVLRSTKTYPATFAFDTVELVWKRFGNWMLPFAGRAFFVSNLQSFVGLSKDPDTFGHLCCCKEEFTNDPPVWKLCKEKLFSEEPAESHVGATLVYICLNMFCLVQCVSIERGDIADQKLQVGKLEKGGEVPQRCCYLYRLTTFSLSYDDNGDLTTGGTCQVQCYKVPEGTSEKFLRKDPVAFWM